MTNESIGFDVFKTKLGWFAIEFSDPNTIRRIKFGLESKQEALAHNVNSHALKPNPGLRETFEQYANGDPSGVQQLDFDRSWMTKFQMAVYEACRKIEPGSALTYEQLAQQAGSPNAARAVGNAMKTNRIPIVIPCHRVLAKSGMGGYSAGDGLDSKLRLLKLEGWNGMQTDQKQLAF